jgi:hypothetical protein
MGNRGLLHNERQEIVRSFKLKAWITCVLEFKGRRRKVMTPGLYTELFFLDEATAFAAGHRPCFECRREDALRFKRFWLEGNPEYGFDERTRIAEIDAVLHRERVDRGGQKVLFEEQFSALPNGSFIMLHEEAWLVADGLVYRWSPAGYGAGEPGAGAVEDGASGLGSARGKTGVVEPGGVIGAAGLVGAAGVVSVLTPRSVVNAFRAGYVPQVAALPERA